MSSILLTRAAAGMWKCRVLLIVTIVLLSPPGLAAQEGAAWRGVLFGTVRDSSGARLAAVQVVALKTGIQSVSDDSGTFKLTGLPTGPVAIEVRRLGYVPAMLTVSLGAGESRELRVVMAQSSDMLAPMVVKENSLRGKMSGFNSRRSRGIGSFVTREDIERRHPGKVSEMLRFLPGIHVTQENSDMRPSSVGMNRSLRTTSQENCAVRFYVDGHAYPDGRLDDFRPAEVEGIEIYRSASEIPADFRTRDSMCGVIVIWTRDPEARGKP